MPADQPPLPQILGSMNVSLDGFVADNGGDWPRPFETPDPGHGRFLAGVGTVVMGRATYERSLALAGGFPFARHDVLVVTSAPLTGAQPRVAAWTSGVPALIRHLRATAASTRPAWIAGGPCLQNALIAAGGIDQLDIFVIPMLLGSGVPLGRGLAARARLDLVSSKVLGAGIVRLRYRPPEVRAAA
ncbi:MAG: dihydrofolate reductase family protein [Rhizobiales bacterium]|nr:dihydrofolate reductase family protein [Hyphomicrobiales bacterium]